MQAPKLPAMFSLFRQRGARGFDFPTRYYDAEKEEREKRHKAVLEGDRATRDLFRERLHHSWHRERSSGAHLQRLVIIIGLVTAILFFIIKAFGLVQF
jgi:hypothetical protein